jgi:hypothetical protein
LGLPSYWERLKSIPGLSKAALVFVVLGTVLRAAQFVANRSLWRDEAALALNIVNRSYLGLTQPLDLDQAAPFGFLFLEKLLVQVLGNRDYILRLLPLLAGIAAMVLMYVVARNYVGGVGALAATGLFALCSSLVYFSSEVKQYSSDVLITLLLLFLAYKCLETGAATGNYLALALGGVAAMWFSHPAVLTLAGIGLGLAAAWWSEREPRRLLWLGVSFVVWAANLAILYLVALRPLASNDYLLEFWSSAFLPLPPWRNPGWISKAVWRMLRNPVGFASVDARRVGLVLSLGGCVSILLRKPRLALVLLVPFVAAFAASALQKYPFRGRLLLFLLPMVFLLIGEGIEMTRRLIAKVTAGREKGAWVGPAAGLALMGLLLYAPASAALDNLGHPYMREDIKPVLAYLQQHKRDTDFIYVYYGADPAFEYYAPAFGLKPGDYTVSVMARDQPEQYAAEIERLSAYSRVWFVFSHRCPVCRMDEKKFFIEHLEAQAKGTQRFGAPGASLYLFKSNSPGS